MSSLTPIDKRKLERALGMGSGYVANFSNKTFSEFFLDNFGIDIYDRRYDRGSGSKANRMRRFWDDADDHTLGRVLNLLFQDWEEYRNVDTSPEPPAECLAIIERLKAAKPVPDLDAIVPLDNEASFGMLAAQVREAIESGNPEAGLDRLHTFATKFLRKLCANCEIDTPREKPLHSLLGEYLKVPEVVSLLQSSMSVRILKSSISVLEAFNHVRNELSLAHDNNLLSRDEAILVLSHISSLVRFLREIERRRSSLKARSNDGRWDDIPF